MIRKFWNNCVARTRRPNLARQKRQERRIRREARIRRMGPAALLVAGWAAVSTGLAELTGAPEVVWPITSGAFALGLFGYRRLWLTLWIGLDALSKVKRDSPDDY